MTTTFGTVRHTDLPATRPVVGVLRLDRVRAARLMSALVVLATLVGAGGTVLDGGALRGPDAMQGSARGTALVLVLLALPTLLVAAARGSRGSARGVVVWLGALGYVVYNSVLLLFGTPANRYLAAYIAMLGLALFAVATLVAAVDLGALDDATWPSLPARSLAAYIGVVVGLNALMWLRGLLPGLGATGAPDYLDGTGLATSPTYVQDLAFWLPMMALGALWLARLDPRGVLVAGAGLAMWVLESASVAVDQWWGSRADPSSPAVSATVVPFFAVYAVLGLVPLWLVLRHLDGRD